MTEHAENLAEALEDLLATDFTIGSVRQAREALAAYRAAAPRMTDAEIVEQAIRLAASTVDSTEQVKFYLLRVADEIARVLAKRKTMSEHTT